MPKQKTTPKKSNGRPQPMTPPLSIRRKPGQKYKCGGKLKK